MSVPSVIPTKLPFRCILINLYLISNEKRFRETLERNIQVKMENMNLFDGKAIAEATKK